MIEIFLANKNIITMIDDCDSDLIEFHWFATGQNGKHYAIRTYRDIELRYKQNNKKHIVYLHRLIMERIIGGAIPKDRYVDHKDGNRMNNTRENLRLATYAQNVQNSRKLDKNKTGFKGVCYRAKYNKYEASIMANGKWKYLGHFDTPEAAHEAYKKAAKELHGEFARFE